MRKFAPGLTALLFAVGAIFAVIGAERMSERPTVDSSLSWIATSICFFVGFILTCALGIVRIRDDRRATPWLILDGISGRLPDRDHYSPSISYARVRVTNTNPAAQVRGAYARLLDFGLVKDGVWHGHIYGYLPLPKTPPHFDILNLRRAPGEAGDFHTVAHFDLATVGQLGYPNLLYLARADRESGREEFYMQDEYGALVEVGVSNRGVKPVSQWFKLTFTSQLPDQLRIESIPGRPGRLADYYESEATTSGRAQR